MERVKAEEETRRGRARGGAGDGARRRDGWGIPELDVGSGQGREKEIISCWPDSRGIEASAAASLSRRQTCIQMRLPCTAQWWWWQLSCSACGLHVQRESKGASSGGEGTDDVAEQSGQPGRKGTLR